MKYLLILMISIFPFFQKINANVTDDVYIHKFKSINGEIIDLGNYKGKVIVIVNVASRCGFTNQYEDLQEVWNSYKDKNLIVVGVPTNNFKQEPGSNNDIKKFCELNFGIDFPLTEKTNVIGGEAHSFYKWAKNTYGIKAVPKWNFHKIIIDKKGKVSKTFSSITKPTSKKFINFIENEIKS